MTKKKPNQKKTNTTHVRVSIKAKEHLFEYVLSQKSKGLSESGTAILNELIFSLPLQPTQEGK